MKRTKGTRFVIYLFAAAILFSLTEGCRSSRKCGCGSDIGSLYKPSKRYR